MNAPNRLLKTIRPTLATSRPLTHYLEGFHEVLIPEDDLDICRARPEILGQIMIDCIDSNLCPFFMSPLYEIEDEEGDE